MSTIDFQPRGTALAAAGGLSLVVGLVLLGPAAAEATTTATPTATAPSSSTPTADDSESPSATESESATSEPTRDDATATDDETAASAEESTPAPTEDPSETPGEAPGDEATDSSSAETDDTETDDTETDDTETPSGITLSCPSTEVVAGESTAAPISASSNVTRLEVSNSVGTAGGEARISGTDLAYTAPDPSTVDGTVTEVYTILATADDGTTKHCEATFFIMPAESQDASETPSATETTDEAEEPSEPETSPTEVADAEDFLPGAGQETTSSPEDSASGTAPSGAASDDAQDASLPVPGGPQPTHDGGSAPEADEDADAEAAEPDASQGSDQSPAPGPDTGRDTGQGTGQGTGQDTGRDSGQGTGQDSGRESGRTSAPAAGSSDAASPSASPSSSAGGTDREPADGPVAGDHDADDGLMLTSSSASPIVAVALTVLAVGAALLSVLGRRAD